MPFFSQRLTLALEKLVNDQFAAIGRTVEYTVHCAKLLGADRDNGQTLILSAGLSAYPLPLAPLGVSAPALLVVLNTDQPVDIRTNAPADTAFLSSVRLWALGGFISNIFITTGSADTTLWLKVAGGSHAQLDTTFPLP